MLQVVDVLSPTNARIRENCALTLEGFLEQPEEKTEREDLHSKLFSYMFTRCKVPSCLILKDLKALYAESILCHQTFITWSS